MSASDPENTAFRTLMDYFRKWKILMSVLAILGFALGIFVVVDRVFFHQPVVVEPDSEPYKHKFAADKVGFKNPRKVLTINTPERRLLVEDAIKEGLVVNNFKLDPLKDEGLYLIKYIQLELSTTVRKSDINKMTLEMLDEPEVNEEPILSLDAMAYFGPRALQTIQSPNMVNILSEAENVRFKQGLEVDGVISLNSDGTSIAYGKKGLSEDFNIILPIDEGLPYFKAQVDINNPNADELLKEYQEANKG